MLNVAFQISILIIIYNLHRLTYKYHRLVQNNSDKPGELPAVERCVVDEDEEDEEEVMLFMAILLVQGQNWPTSLNSPLVLRRIFHKLTFGLFAHASLFFFMSILNDIKGWAGCSKNGIDDHITLHRSYGGVDVSENWKVTGPNKG